MNSREDKRYGKRTINTLMNKSKPVGQYDSSGDLIQRYYGATEAMRITGIPQGNICCVLKGKRRTAGGYYWKYLKEDNNES